MSDRTRANLRRADPEGLIRNFFITDRERWLVKAR